MLTQSLPKGKMLAVSYDRVTEGAGAVAVGGYDSGSRKLHLKLLRHDDSTTPSGWERTRLYELKNIYDLGAEDIPEDGFQLTIRRQAASGEDQEVNASGVTYVKLLGLDTTEIGRRVERRGPDLDRPEERPSDLPALHAVLPRLRHDGVLLRAGWQGRTPSTTRTSSPTARRTAPSTPEDNFQAGDDDYYLVVKYNRPKTTFYLGQINIIENSEVVRLNGVRLTRGTDYTIYYPAGQLTHSGRGGEGA